MSPKLVFSQRRALQSAKSRRVSRVTRRRAFHHVSKSVLSRKQNIHDDKSSTATCASSGVKFNMELPSCNDTFVYQTSLPKSVMNIRLKLPV